MNEQLPIPCPHCNASGLRSGVECKECRGKGYRLIAGGEARPVRTGPPQRLQSTPPRRR